VSTHLQLINIIIIIFIIRGLWNKIDELFMLRSSNFPHVLYFTEHHLCNDEINCIYINSYNLGAKYCRVNCKYGGVRTFVHETLSFTTTDLSKFCNDQDIEICAVKSHFSSSNFCILSYIDHHLGILYIFEVPLTLF
jgi:hypothetical protein